MLRVRPVHAYVTVLAIVTHTHTYCAYVMILIMITVNYNIPVVHSGLDYVTCVQYIQCMVAHHNEIQYGGLLWCLFLPHCAFI